MLTMGMLGGEEGRAQAGAEHQGCWTGCLGCTCHLPGRGT